MSRSTIQATSAPMILTVALCILLASCATPPPTVTPSPLPSVVPPTTQAAIIDPSRTALPTLTPSAVPTRIVQAVQTAVSAGSTPPAATQPPQAPPPTQIAASATQIQPTSTSALLAVTANVSFTPLPTQAALSPGIAPPLDIKLPDSWRGAYYVLPIRDALIQMSMNMAIYKGPVKNGGIGTIVILWGFPSIGPMPTIGPAGPTPTLAPSLATPMSYQMQLLWGDGLRLLQGTVVGLMCNVGRYEQLTFTVGGQPGVGAYYNVSKCPDEPDTAGWFVGLNQFGGNYLFYTYVEPIEAYNEGRGDLQKILDTVVFHAPAATPGGPPPTNTPK
ncbi:MAG: hypothetical protein ABI947_08280 [Chloroflexota bacterium]